MSRTAQHIDQQNIRIGLDDEVTLDGFLAAPTGAEQIVLFAHGSGSSRHSPRNQSVARTLNEAGCATLLFDLLTEEEEFVDHRTRKLRFDIPLLAQRLTGSVDWIDTQGPMRDWRIGLFGASTGAAAALITAAQRPNRIGAVVSRGGRADLADNALPQVQAPTLLIVGGLDREVIGMNRDAAERMSIQPTVEIVEGATHLFEEPGKLNEVADLARRWFARHLQAEGR